MPKLTTWSGPTTKLKVIRCKVRSIQTIIDYSNIILFFQVIASVLSMIDTVCLLSIAAEVERFRRTVPFYLTGTVPHCKHACSIGLCFYLHARSMTAKRGT